ncbi:hypothetical protein DV736_g4420, partial [Chaetothyriales sp. CBS 134916]
MKLPFKTQLLVSTGAKEPEPPLKYLCPVSYRTSDGDIALAELDDEDFLASEFSVDRLNNVFRHLWLAGLPVPPRPLHHQLVLQREIVITEKMDMHLVWTSGRIFIKPMPRDFAIAKDRGLLPTQGDLPTWADWRKLVEEVITPTVYEGIHCRFYYGELRLGRLNAIYLLAKFGYYMNTWPNYVSFLGDQLGWLAATTIYIVLVLTAMQVGLATDQLRNSGAFMAASWPANGKHDQARSSKMNRLATPPVPPHFHEHNRLSPNRQSALSRWRDETAADWAMSTSPHLSHARLPATPLPPSRKRARPNSIGRPLSVDRLLETLDKDSLRTILASVCSRNADIKEQVVLLSPRPSIESTLQVLRQYYDKLIAAFPLDPNPHSDYCYDRVRPQRQALLDALADFTPQFLPPNESQSAVSLEYLDGITQIVHDLPEWDTAQYNVAKQNAYEEISGAWTAVVKEASKRGGGIQLQCNGWEEKLRVHNERSGGLMKDAHNELIGALGWLHLGANVNTAQQLHRQDIRQQLFSGTFGMDQHQHQQPMMRTGMR